MKGGEKLEQNKKEEYKKPAIKTEEIELNVYGQYGEVEPPVAQLQPFFGLCCP